MLACTGITNVTNAFAGIGNPAVVLFDWRAGNRAEVLRPQPNFQGTGWGVIWHPTGFLAGVGGGNGAALWFWRPDQAIPFHTLALPGNARDLDLHADAPAGHSLFRRPRPYLRFGSSLRREDVRKIRHLSFCATRETIKSGGLLSMDPEVSPETDHNAVRAGADVAR